MSWLHASLFLYLLATLFYTGWRVDTWKELVAIVLARVILSACAGLSLVQLVETLR